MNMQPTNSQTNVELRLRTMRTLWIAMLLTIGGYYVLTIFMNRSENVTPNPVLSLVLLCVGLVITLISFPIKNRLVSKAVEKQQVGLVQQGYIVGWALTEVAGLLGLFDFFVTGHRHYYVLLIIAALGTLLQYPRREAVENAAFKRAI